MFEALVFGVNSHCHVGHDGFGALGSDDDALARITFQGVIEVEQLGVFLAVNHLFVGQYCFRLRVPVGHAQAPVNAAFFVQIHKNPDYGFRQAVFHRKAGTFPITGSAQAFELIEDDAAVFVFPLKSVFEELIAANVGFADALCAQLLHHLGFGRN